LIYLTPRPPVTTDPVIQPDRIADQSPRWIFFGRGSRRRETESRRRRLSRGGTESEEVGSGEEIRFLPRNNAVVLVVSHEQTGDDPAPGGFRRSRAVNPERLPGFMARP
jgi:hypothetical protein